MSAVEKQTLLHSQLPLGSKERARLRKKLIPRTTHGGVESVRKRKTARPYATNVPIHLVLKSKRAKGLWSLLHRKNKARTQISVYQYAERFKIQVYRSAVIHNHIHLLVKTRDRKNLADFLRVLAGRIAINVTGANKGVKKIGKFWDHLTWSRLVNWGKDFYHVRKYVLENSLDEFSKETRTALSHSLMNESFEAGPPD